MVELHWGAATDCGRVRSRNEDSLLAAPPIFVVADGMGGRAGGLRASRLAVAPFRRLAVAGTLTAREVLTAADDANAAILDAAEEPGYAGMGTTLVGLALVADGADTFWLGFNIGDSRLYRLAGGRLEQVSVDHSEVAELISAGVIGSTERRGHPRGHVITRALGISAVPRVDCWLLHPVPGERFLLCSDGLTDEVPDRLLAALLGDGGRPSAAARLLVRAAVEAGGRDNVTTIVVEVGAG